MSLKVLNGALAPEALMLMLLSSLLLFITSPAVCHSASLRKVDCSNAFGPINKTMEDLYSPFFRNFEEYHARTGKDTLNFEALIPFVTVPSGAADAMELLVTLQAIEEAVAPKNVSVDQVIDAWQTHWYAAGHRAAASASSMASKGQNRSAAHAYARAWNYLTTGERFADHLSQPALNVYKEAIKYFHESLRVSNSSCQPVHIPFNASASASVKGPDGLKPVENADTELHGYWCQAEGGSSGSAAKATIILMTGYDGTAELLLQSTGFAAVAAGYNVLAFEGPGQGYVARFEGLRFQPDWEAVVSPVADWAASNLPGAHSPENMVLWGLSFGGYLAPRAFAKDSRFRACVADGGLYDFYQDFVCQLPEDLRQLLYTDQNKFSEEFKSFLPYSLSLTSVFRFGDLGFGAGTKEPAKLYEAVQPYTLKGVLDGVGTRPVLVHSPALDTLTGNQSNIFFDALPRPLNEHTSELQLDPRLGTGLHCSVGSTSIAVDTQLDWLEQVISA